MNKRIIIPAILIIFIFFVSILYATKEKKIIKIAACPTFHYLKNDLIKQGAEFIAAGSTAESLALLSNFKVDMVLAGRTLKPEEPDFNYLILGDGCCSFISQAAAKGEEEDLSSSPGQTEQILFEKDFDNFVFYTNLDPVEIKGFFPNIKNVEKIDNIYESLDNGIIGVISWENMDYSLANMVHVLNLDGTRYKKSRIPIVYYRENSVLNRVDEIKEIIKDTF